MEAPAKRGFVDPPRVFSRRTGSADIRRVHLYDTSIHPCTACGHCTTPGNAFSKTLTPFYDAIDEADLQSISMPCISLSSRSAQTFIDRSHVSVGKHAARGASGKTKRETYLYRRRADTGLFLPTETIIRHFFNALNTFIERRIFSTMPAWKDGIQAISPENTCPVRLTRHSFHQRLHRKPNPTRITLRRTSLPRSPDHRPLTWLISALFLSIIEVKRQE